MPRRSLPVQRRTLLVPPLADGHILGALKRASPTPQRPANDQLLAGEIAQASRRFWSLGMLPWHGHNDLLHSRHDSSHMDREWGGLP